MDHGRFSFWNRLLINYTYRILRKRESVKENRKIFPVTLVTCLPARLDAYGVDAAIVRPRAATSRAVGGIENGRDFVFEWLESAFIQVLFH